MVTFPFAIASVVALTALAWIARRAGRWPICPICAGVAGTWSGLLVARAAGLAVEPAVLAMLLGASVVAAAQWVEARMPPERSALAWKALALPAGFVAAYGMVVERWAVAAVAAATVAALAGAFLRPRAGAADPAVVAQLAERMKKCC